MPVHSEEMEQAVSRIWAKNLKDYLTQKPWWVVMEEAEFAELVEAPCPHCFDRWVADFSRPRALPLESYANTTGE